MQSYMNEKKMIVLDEDRMVKVMTTLIENHRKIDHDYDDMYNEKERSSKLWINGKFYFMIEDIEDDENDEDIRYIMTFHNIKDSPDNNVHIELYRYTILNLDDVDRLTQDIKNICTNIKAKFENVDIFNLSTCKFHDYKLITNGVYCKQCEIKQININKVCAETKVCAICLDETKSHEIWAYNSLRTLCVTKSDSVMKRKPLCDHYFHYCCILKVNSNNRKCPLCRCDYKPDLI